MSKKILPFPLVMKNGAKVRTIEDLRANADIETIVSAYLDGKLNRWCKAFYYDNISDQIDEVSETMIRKLYSILEIEINDEELKSYLEENFSLQSEAVRTVSAEDEVVDYSDIKNKLNEYVKDGINLDDYAIEVTPIENEDGKVNQYKVVIQNKTSKMYCSFFLSYTATNDEEAKDKWSQNLCSNIANAMQKMKETAEYNNEDHSQNITSIQEEDNEYYSVILVDAGANKIAVIKEVREITGWGLAEAKDVCDIDNQVLIENISKDEALNIKNRLFSLGATVEIIMR